ncbi:hypothetical protein E4U35_006458 [Claviceps purpurea]|nr:hypothetical protein E4U35_006458 [Claviceps purpurea]KAG6306606.1 hypothetical protein E4U45_006775 [Claviceps purpurea]
MTLRIFNACAGISSYQSWTRVIAYRDVSIASFGDNVQGAGAVGAGVQGPGLGRFKLVALVMLGGLRTETWNTTEFSSSWRLVPNAPSTTTSCVLDSQPRGLSCPTSRPGCPSTKPTRPRAGCAVFSNREGTRATWKLSVDIGILGSIFAPVTATPEFGGGTTHTAVLSG